MQCNLPFQGYSVPNPNNACHNIYNNNNPMFNSTYGQYVPFNNCGQGCPMPPPVPEVRGEGELISIVYPDGSLQFFFMPTTVQWSANFSGPYGEPSNQAWHVRNVSNPIPASVFHQYYPHLAQYANTINKCLRFTNPTCNPVYQNKFHQDGWSSTTDLQYFFPSLRISEWIPKVDATVQIVTPAEKREIQYQIVNNPCNCEKSAVKKQSVECMAVDEPKLELKAEPKSQPKKCIRPVLRKPQKSVNFRGESATETESECPDNLPNKSSLKKKKPMYRCKRSTARAKVKKPVKYCCCGCEDRARDKSVATVSEQKCGSESRAGRGTNTPVTVSAGCSSRPTDTPQFPATPTTTSSTTSSTTCSDTEGEEVEPHRRRWAAELAHHHRLHCAVCPVSSPLYYRPSTECLQNEITYSDSIM